ncbi:UNVERIFIED_CONTAM: hypothetical protein PYX00_010574 [Menopon gallinae]|uniref:FHA domain-containing protein n=1 Tax=Menopon gallinae TaxID=328185 RepID=A0AAW2HG54_9NEOP
MVTLKNTGGVELDKDGIMTNMYNCEVPQAEGVKPEGGGHAKAVLIPGKSSHPFQERTLTLDQTVKIGRSVARIRPSATNGIFDCKVLSRNHAVIWYDNKKFYIQDTKSSNGTFVNNHRLSKGSEDSLPREIYSGDVVQFGVDVLENQRKGKEDSKNSDESNRIVTHGCIIATVKLYYPNGKEADSSQSSTVPKSDLPQEEICKLQMIIYEAQQREARLHDKLEELQFIVGKLEVACQDALTNRFEETRLLSKIENLEKQTRVMRKIRQGSIDKTSEKAETEIHQLLIDVEKVQCASREIQEMQHRKLLETEQKLAEAQTAATNLQSEVFALREHASRSETHIQELAARCTNFSQTIDVLKTNLAAQIEANQDLEARLAEIQQREAEFRSNFYQNSELLKDKGRLITEECEDDDVPKKDKDNEDIVLEWIYKCYTKIGNFDQKDRINEDDRTEYLKKLISSLRDALCNGLQNISTCLGQLDAARVEFERSKDDVDKYLSQKEELMSQVEVNRRFRCNKKKSQNELYSEVNKAIIMSSNLDKVSKLEEELREQEELLNEARQKKNESERKYNKLKGELDSTKFKFEMLSQEGICARKVIENSEADFITGRVDKIDSEKFIAGDDGKLSADTQGMKEVVTDNKECQTVSVVMKTSETNTGESRTDLSEEEYKIIEELNGSLDKYIEEEEEEDDEISTPYAEITAAKDSEDTVAVPEDSPDAGSSPEQRVPETSPREQSKDSLEISSSNLGIWEKIERIQSLSSSLSSESSTTSDIEIKEIRCLLNLIAEDLVRLLMHEQQMNKDKQVLQEKLDKSMSQADIAALGLANHFFALIVGLFLYYIGERALEFMGFSR